MSYKISSEDVIAIILYDFERDAEIMNGGPLPPFFYLLDRVLSWDFVNLSVIATPNTPINQKAIDAVKSFYGDKQLAFYMGNRDNPDLRLGLFCLHYNKPFKWCIRIDGNALLTMTSFARELLEFAENSNADYNQFIGLPMGLSPVILHRRLMFDYFIDHSAPRIEAMVKTNQGKYTHRSYQTREEIPQFNFKTFLWQTTIGRRFIKFCINNNINPNLAKLADLDRTFYSTLQCSICESDNLLNLGHKDSFLLIQCKNCNFYFSYPNDFSKEETQRIYGNSNADYFGKFEKDGQYWPLHLTYRLEILLSDMSAREIKPDGKRLLEIGCCDGGILKTAHEKGFSVIGVEPDASLMNYLDIPCFTGDFLEDFKPEDKFDVIMAFHTLEHVGNPGKVLKKIFTLLKPGGTFFGAIPNYECSIKRYGIFNNPDIFPPVHINYFTEKTLKTIVNHYGFINFRIKSDIGLEQEIIFMMERT